MKATVPDNAIPIPEGIAQLNTEIEGIEERIQNLRGAMQGQNEALAGHRQELAKLDIDEQTKLLALGEAEAGKASTKAIRDALDSIRGRRALLGKKIEAAEADQAGRAQTLKSLSKDLTAKNKAREAQLSRWLRGNWEEKKAELYAEARAANFRLFAWMRGLGQVGIRANEARWLYFQLIPEEGRPVIESNAATLRQNMITKALRERAHG